MSILQLGKLGEIWDFPFAQYTLAINPLKRIHEIPFNPITTHDVHKSYGL